MIEFEESAGEFHARPLPDDAAPQVWWNRLTAPAVVLGSTQRDESIVDHAGCTRHGVEVVRRRSGGGAVLLVPGDVTWLDVIIPRDHDAWRDDIHAPMVWFGRHFVDAMSEICNLGDVDVHRGSMVTTEWSKLVCFDGLAPGEVTLGAEKLLGISQRRTRDAARLQCCWYRRHDAELLIELLSADIDGLRPVATIDTDDAFVHDLVDRLGVVRESPPDMRS